MRQPQWNLNVFLGGQRGKEVRVLEHHADAFTAQSARAFIQL